MHEQLSPGTLKYTFRLDADTTVDGLVQETELVAGRLGWKLTMLGAATNGTSVDASTIMNVPFIDIPAIEWCLELAYRGRGVDLMDLVDISIDALDRWGTLGKQTIRELMEAEQITASEVKTIPDPRIEVMPNGELRIFTSIAGRTVEMFVPRGEWHLN